MAREATKPSDGESKLWGGRFTEGMDPLMIAYNESINFDKAFYSQDIRGSIAYARANVRTGILTQTEFETIEKGLNQVLEEWEEGKFEIKPGIDEDIHTANERLDLLIFATFGNSNRLIKQTTRRDHW